MRNFVNISNKVLIYVELNQASKYPTCLEGQRKILREKKGRGKYFAERTENKKMTAQPGKGGVESVTADIITSGLVEEQKRRLDIQF